MSKLISFETAKLAHKRGFPQKESVHGFLFNGEESYDYGLDFINAKALARPDQDTLQAWLEEQGMYISYAAEMYTTGINWNWQVLWYLPKDQWEESTTTDDDGNTQTNPSHIFTGTGWYGDNGEFPTRYEALEGALHMALMKMDLIYRHNSIEGLSKLYKVDMNSMLDKIRPFSKELGDWSFREFTMEQLEIILSKIGRPDNV